MGNLSPSSFRRILLSRILLLSIPVLLIGEYVVYRKARSGVLETARHNLAQSAARKAENIQTNIEMLRANLVASSQAFSLQSDQPQAAQTFVQQMRQWLPNTVQCIQITNAVTGQVVESTCGAQMMHQGIKFFKPSLSPGSSITPADVRLGTAAPALSEPELPDRDRPQVNLIFTAPVYAPKGELSYLLSIRTNFQLHEVGQQSSLQGYTVVIDREGMILAHLKSNLVGKTIDQQPNGPALKAIVESAIAGEQDALHLFEEKQTEWIAGYTAVQIPIQGATTQTWVILAQAPVENALYSLQDIQNVLVFLTLGLIGASVLATVFVAKELATPLEKLGNYALEICDRLACKRAPKNFKIKELNQLAEALDQMVDSLEEQAEELETAWQQALTANQLKSNFLATTSHELRTPLNAIIGCIRLVKDDCCDSWEESLDFLQQADDAAIHLLKIINDLLDIAKIEAGKVELNLQTVSIPDLCQQCLKMVQPAAEKKHITLTLETDFSLPPIALDERRVQQMVINLLANAVKFTPEHGSIQLKAHKGYGHQLIQEYRPDQSPIAPSMTYLCLEVSDSGIGIPPDRWHLLFRPFQQIDAATQRKPEGTGLGLALTKHLVELHGGTLSFKSTLERGSVFKIWLPAQVGLSPQGSNRSTLSTLDS